MEAKDIIAAVGITGTFLFSAANLVHSLWSDKRTSFVNTVTTSRLKWIDSLRDKVSEFIAVTTRLLDVGSSPDEKGREILLLQQDTLLHQIVLHLNPHDPEDKKIKELADHVCGITARKLLPKESADELGQLRDATADYLKKEWNRVKAESTEGRS